MKIHAREVPDAARDALMADGIHPVLARLYAARGIETSSQLAQDLAALLPPDGLRGISAAVARLAQAADTGQAVLVVADYDCDGATACAVAVRGLRMLGVQVDYLVPNRFEHGYGLTPTIVELAAAHPRLGKPDLLITVDNGIASIDGVERATQLGIDVLVTDHHLPGDALPAAAAIVNPNQPGCGFASKNLAGVGVMFYVLLALRALLRERGILPTGLSQRCKVCSTWSRSGRSPTWCALTETIGCWSPQGFGVSEPEAHNPAWPPYSQSPAAIPARPHAPTWAFRSARGSTRPEGLPTSRSASNACLPRTLSARMNWPRHSMSSTGNDARSRLRCAMKRSTM